MGRRPREPWYRRARAAYQATSREAFHSVLPLFPQRIAAILAFIAEHHGATTREVRLGLGLKHQAVSPRICDLVRHGYVEVTREGRVEAGVTVNVWIPVGWGGVPYVQKKHEGLTPARVAEIEALYAPARQALTTLPRWRWREIVPLLTEVDREIFTTIVQFRGAICEEIVDRTTLLHQTVSAQIRYMRLGRVLIPSGQYRKTRAKVRAIVWSPAWANLGV